MTTPDFTCHNGPMFGAGFDPDKALRRVEALAEDWIARDDLSAHGHEWRVLGYQVLSALRGESA